MQIEYPLIIPSFPIKLVKKEPEGLPNYVKDKGKKLSQVGSYQHKDDEG